MFSGPNISLGGRVVLVIILNVSSHTLRRMNNIDMILRGPENAENCDCFRALKCDFRDEMTYIGNGGR